MTLARPQPTVTITATAAAVVDARTQQARARADAERAVGATWIDADSRRHLSGADAALVTRFAEALQDADRLQLELPALLHLARDHQAGQPRAQSLTPSTGGSAPIDSDDPDAVPTGHHDPTGDAGTSHDRAAADEREIRRQVAAAIRAIDTARSIAYGYPLQSTAPLEQEPTAGEDWCRCCFKDGKYLQPVAVKPDGTKKYAGLCSWCGPFKAANGFEPPTEMLHAKHRGERITEPMVAAARAEWRRLNPEAKKKTKGGKKRNRAKQSA